MPALFATDQRRVNTFFDRAIGIFEKHAVKSDQKWMFTYAKCLLQFGSMKFELWKAGGLQFSMAGKADSPELDAMVRDADQHLTQCVQITSKIDEASSARTLHGLASAKLGDVALANRDTSRAVSCYKEALAIREFEQGYASQAADVKRRLEQMAKS